MDYNKKSLAVSSMLFPSLNSSLDGISIDLFLYGCKRHCKNCHNKELQEFKAPNHSIADILAAIRRNIQYNVKVVTILGGEPLDTDNDTLIALILAIKNEFPNLKVSMYTGYEMSQIPLKVLKVLDYVKTGEYDEIKPSKFGSFLATTNQRMFKKSSDGTFLQQYPMI